MRSTHTNTHTPKHTSQEWRGAAKTRVQGHTPTPHAAARSGGVHAERAQKHTHTSKTQPGVAGRRQNPSLSTHIHTGRCSQEWRGTSGARTETHTHPNSQARSGGAQPKPEPKDTHPRHTPQPGVAGYKRSAQTNTHKPQYPSQGWQGAAETRSQGHKLTPHAPARDGGVQAERTQTHTHPNTQARSGGVQPKPELRHPHPRCTPQPGVAGYKRGAHTNTHRPQQSSQEWRHAVKTPDQAQTPTRHTRARNCGVQAEHAHNHTRPKAPARNGGVQAKTRAQPHRPQTPARNGGAKPKPVPKHTHHRP